MEEEKKTGADQESMGSVTTERLGIFSQFMEILRKYGVLKTILGAFVFVIFSYLAYMAVNPKAMFERYDQYVEARHEQSNIYRRETAPLIRSYLNQVALELGCEYVFILEYHNGKSNSTGLQWQFADMTFINDGPYDVSEEYQNLSLVKYPIFYKLYEDSYWAGTIDDLRNVDARLAARMESHDAKHFGYVVMYGSGLMEIGVLGVVYRDNLPADPVKTRRTLQRYGSTISPLLDGKNAFVK